MVILAFVIIVKGGENGNTLTMFDPGQTSLFGITGGGVLGGILLGILLFVGFEAAASIGEESEDPHRSIPRALIGTVAVAAAFFVLMAYAFSIGYGKAAVSEGKWASSPSAVSEMATKYVGKWFATILELVVILDAMALALAICVMIGRGFFALGPRRPAAVVLREDVPSRHAVGRQPDGRGRRHRPRPARDFARTTARSSASAVDDRPFFPTTVPSSPPRRSARSRSSSSTSCSPSRRSGSCARAGTSRGST